MPTALQDKSPLVEELEDALLDLCQGRAAAAERRRSAGDAEEAAPAEAAATAAAAVLSRGGGAAAAAAAAEAAAGAAEERQLGLDLPVELDEFGRDTNAERKAELADRWAQRGTAWRVWCQSVAAALRCLGVHQR
jgi:GC-rich sequence DNA-binding factor